jgi:ferric-dicitrate binding protein FerR (iron transport regulator)
MENVTRDIIADLYPLYLSGDVSADSRKMVETFLSEDQEFARSLAETGRDSLAAYAQPSLPPDHELKTLAKVKRRLWGPMGLLQLAIFASCVAFGRIVSDTSFDVSPRKFIVTAVIAACFWVAFFVKLFRGRRAVLVRLR